MSDSLAFAPSPVADKQTTKPAGRFSLTRMFHAVMESLVDANSRRFEASEPQFYRYPPV